MSKKSNLYLKILVLLTLIMGFNCQDCSNHSAFKIYCHKDEKVAKSISFMHEEEVYCQCNGPRFGCEPNKACGVNAYIYSPSSEITLKLTMTDENGEAYKIAFPGSLMLDLWWRYKFFAMDDEPLNAAEPSDYAYCYVMMDELKARFKALRNKKITNTTPPEEFELSCNSQDIVKIMLYKSNINKYVNIVHKDHIIEAWEDGNIKQRIEEPHEKILEVSIQHFPRITYNISNNLEPKHIILNFNGTPSEKPKVPCTAANCDVPMKVEELEEAGATNKKGIDNNRDAIVQLKNEDRELKADVKQVNSKLDAETRAWNNTVQILNENITAIDHKNAQLSDKIKVNEDEDRRMNKTIHELEARLSKFESRESLLSFLFWILVVIIIIVFIILIAGIILWFVKYRSNSNNQKSNPETSPLVDV